MKKQPDTGECSHCGKQTDENPTWLESPEADIEKWFFTHDTCLHISSARQYQLSLDGIKNDPTCSVAKALVSLFRAQYLKSLTKQLVKLDEH